MVLVPENPENHSKDPGQFRAGQGAPDLSGESISLERPEHAPPPVAPREDTVLEEHGNLRPVPYLWMRDHEDPRLREYLELENVYADQKLKSIRPLQADLLKDYLSRVPEEMVSTPVKDGDHVYYSRQKSSEDYKVHCRRLAADPSSEQILLDENELASGQKFFSLEEFSVSPDGRFAAYLSDLTGDERYELKIKDLKTGALLKDTLRDVGSFTWGRDSSEIYAVKLDDLNRPYKVVRHSVGSEASDEDLFIEPKEDFHVEISGARDSSALIIASGSWESSTAYLLDMRKPGARPIAISGGEPKVQVEADACGDNVFVLSDKDAPNFKLLGGKIRDGALELKELIPERGDEYLQSVHAFNKFALVLGRREGRQVLFALDSETGQRTDIEIPFKAYALTVDSLENPDPDTRKIRLHLSSFVMPPSVYEYDLDQKILTEIEKSFAGPNFNPANYKTETMLARSPDGTEVPMTVFTRADRPSQGPALLIGYGAYGDSYDPEFRSYYLSLIDRGVAVALANIRGGAELGPAWFNEGRLGKKQNSFDDFIACAEKLCADGITSKEELAAYGRSAGGLLMGAMTIQRPDLFKAILSQVPFVDVITTMSDSSINLVEIEKTLWGDPADPEHYKFMLAYSPTDNVTPKNYPHIYFEAGWHDPAVPVSEPAVLTAALRAAKTDDNDIILRTHFGAGHGGASGRVEYFNEMAEAFAFILSKISPSPTPGS